MKCQTEQSGQSSVEYLVVCGALVAALLTPIDGQSSVMDLCMQTLTEWYQAFAFNKSLPVLPD